MMIKRTPHEHDITGPKDMTPAGMIFFEVHSEFIHSHENSSEYVHSLILEYCSKSKILHITYQQVSNSCLAGV